MIESLIQNGNPERLPDRVNPMLVSDARTIPTGPEWSYEPKFDGYRGIAIVGNKNALLHSRRKRIVFSEDFPWVIGELKQLDRNMVLDGELCAVAEDGMAAFELMQDMRRIAKFVVPPKSMPARIVYYPFDILHIDGVNLKNIPLEDRKKILMATVPQTQHIVPVDGFEGDGQEFYDAMNELGYEGIVAKRKKSIYIEGARSPSWKRLKFAPIRGWKR